MSCGGATDTTWVRRIGPITLTRHSSQQAFTVLKSNFTPAEVSALCAEALEKGFKAFNNVAEGDSSSSSPAAAEDGIGDPSFQPVPSRAGRRKRKTNTKANLQLSSFLDQAQGAAGAAGAFVHPEPPPSKKKKTAAGSSGDDGSLNPASGTLAEGTGATEAGEKVDNLAGEVRVEREYGVADKKGQRHQIVRPRTVSTSFGQACVDAYLALVISALSRKMNDLANGAPSKCADGAPSSEKAATRTAGSGTTVPGEASAEDAMVVAGGDDDGDDGSRRAVTAEEVVGVISYTEELRKNVVRTGVPPPLPKYTKVAMWRGEDVCLSQLGAGDMKELMVGIAWCQPQGSRQSVDLDLSVMVSSTGLFLAIFSPSTST